MPQRIEFEGQVHEFPDDFTDDDIAAALGAADVVGLEDEPGSFGRRGPGSVPALAAWATAKAAPPIVAGIHGVAKGVGKVAGARMVRQAGPAFVLYDAAEDVLSGNPAGAAKKAAGAAAVAAVPGVANAVQKATAPTQTGVTRNAAGRFVSLPKPGGVLTRAAAAASRVATPLALGIETVFGEGAAGHRPVGETPERTAQRQREFEQEYRRIVESRRQSGGNERLLDVLLKKLTGG